MAGPLQNVEKILVMGVAAQLARASAGATVVPLSADLSDPAVRAKNLMVWETFRVFYHGIVKALADDNPSTGWPAPALAIGNLAGLVGGPGAAAIAAALQQLLAGLKPTEPITPPLPVGPPLPNPGDVVLPLRTG